MAVIKDFLFVIFKKVILQSTLVRYQLFLTSAMNSSTG